jgi:tol-pal system protein YbgF
MVLKLASAGTLHYRKLHLAAALVIGLSGPALLSSAAFAQDAAAAQLTLRIENLEQQVRDLTGQVQGLQFQLTQLQTMMQRQQGSGDNGAAPPPQPGSSDRQGALSQYDGRAGDELGPSGDPLVGRGRPGEGRRAEEVPLGPAAAHAVAAPPVPQPAPAQTVAIAPPRPPANPEAQAQYKSGYDAVTRGDYSTAADIFKKFIKAYPDDPQAPDATNWLGEALLEQHDYVDAADVLVKGYKAYQDSPRAPDMLLKLGIALAGAQQTDAACKTFGLLKQKYSGTTAAFKNRLRDEMAKDKCSG